MDLNEDFILEFLSIGCIAILLIFIQKIWFFISKTVYLFGLCYSCSKLSKSEKKHTTKISQRILSMNFIWLIPLCGHRTHAPVARSIGSLNRPAKVHHWSNWPTLCYLIPTGQQQSLRYAVLATKASEQSCLNRQ